MSTKNVGQHLWHHYMHKLKEITHAKLKDLRFKQLLKQGCICPILKQEIQFKDSVFDHKRKRKDEPVGKDGKGLLRGVIHRQANVIEGKIARLYKRYGLDKFIALPDLLRNIADYLENPPMKDQRIVHPDERTKPKRERLSKRKYQTICKYYFRAFPRRKKMFNYPKNGYLTKEAKETVDAFDKWLQKECDLIREKYFRLYPRRRKLPEFPKDGVATKEFGKVLRKLERWRKMI